MKKASPTPSTAVLPGPLLVGRFPERGVSASVPTARLCRLQLPGAYVAEEVEAREEVVDTQAVGAGVALADVTLEQALVVDEGRSLAVHQTGFTHRLPAGLTTAWRFHGSVPFSDPPPASAAVRREPDHGSLPLNIAWPNRPRRPESLGPGPGL